MLGNDHLTRRGGGGGGGGRGVMVFFKKNILIPNVVEKKYSDFYGGKKNNMIQSFCHNLMLYSGKKSRALRYKKNKYSNSSERNKKPYPPPPFQVKWSDPYSFSSVIQEY